MKRVFHAARRAALGLLILGLVVAFHWLLPAGQAYAHASLVSADPAPNSAVPRAPERVTARFSEPLEEGFSDIQVLDAQGRRVDKGDSAVDSRQPTVMSVTLQPLPNGTYTVVWTTLSAVDGHPLRSSYVFSVGEPPPGQPAQGKVVPPGQPLVQSPLEPLFRWLVLLGGLALLGGLGFELLVLRPALSGVKASRAVRRVGTQLSSRTTKLLWSAWGLFAAASVGQLLVQATVTTRLSVFKVLGSPVVSIMKDTSWGQMWMWRIALIFATQTILAFSVRARRGDQEDKPASTLGNPPLRVLALATTAGALLTLSWTSHGAALQHLRFQAVLTDFLHLLAAGFWVGGLFYLAAGVPLVTRALPAPERSALLGAVVPRFSALAILSVGTLLITGLYSSWAQVTAWRAVDTPYGLTLAAKVGLLMPLLGLGAVNLLWVRPHLAKGRDVGRWLLRFVTGEAILAATLLLAVGLLISLEPARESASRRAASEPPGLKLQESVEGTTIALDVRPGVVGSNRVLVTLKDRRGDPITNASEVSLRLSYMGAEAGETDVSATSLGKGQYAVNSALLSVAGPWQAALTLRRPDAFDARAAFRFQVAPTAAAAGGTIVPSPDTGSKLWMGEIALLGLLFLGTGVALGGRSSRGGTAVMAIGAAAVLIAIALIARWQLGGGGLTLPTNPISPTEASTTTGRALYMRHCGPCHGTAGRGDGTQAATLGIQPLDLTVHVPLHSDGELYRFVRDGVPRTAMRGWTDTLTPEQVWHVVNFLRTLPVSGTR